MDSEPRRAWWVRSDDPDRLDAARRWERARDYLENTPVQSELRSHRQRLTRRLILVGVIVVPVLLVPVYLGFDDRGFGDPRTAAQGPIWRDLVALDLGLVGLAISVLAAVWILRSMRTGSAWRTVSALLTPEDRKQLEEQVHGRQPVDIALLPQARAYASSLLYLGELPFVWFGMALGGIGRLVEHDPSGSHLLTGITTGIFVAISAVSFPLMLRPARRARQFLQTYPDTPAA